MTLKSCNLCKLGPMCSANVLTKSDSAVVVEYPGKDPYRDKLLREGGVGDLPLIRALSCQGVKPPTDSQIRSCELMRRDQFDQVKPKFVLLFGASAYQSVTGTKGITKVRGRPFVKDGITYVPTLSPAYTMRYPETEPTILRDIELFKTVASNGEIPRAKKLKLVMVDTWEKLNGLCKKLKGEWSLDTESTGLFPWAAGAYMNTLQLSNGKRDYVIPLEHPESVWKGDSQRVIDKLDEHMHRVRLIMHNGKFDCLWLKVHYRVNWQDYLYHDTMLAHYMLDENSPHGLKALAMRFLGAPDWDVDRETKVGGPLDKLSLYGAHDSHYTFKLSQVFEDKLKLEPHVHKVYREIMIPIAQEFVYAEYQGVWIDVTRLDEMRDILVSRLDVAQRSLAKYGNINWGSPQQVGKLFFDELKLPVVERTESGNPSVSESVLKRLNHPAVSDLLEYRSAKQQLSFFVNGWRPYLVGEWLHPSFKLHGTVTGRFSCENPNLQQVPRDPLIRSIISAPPGWVLIEADLSQIELRIAAEMANANSMIRTFKKNIDIHWRTAIGEARRSTEHKKLIRRTYSLLGYKQKGISVKSNVLLATGPDKCIAVAPEWKEIRKKAKAINFGFLYGMWWTKFLDYARDNYGITLTPEQAQKSRKNFFEMMPELEPWQRRMKAFARMHGYVESLSGRKRRLPMAKLKEDTPQRREAERQAVNSPVQSFANELNLMVALQVRREYSRSKVKIVGMVHDATLYMVRQRDAVKTARRILYIMSRPKMLEEFGIKLRVPLEGDVKMGKWGKGLSYEEYRRANPRSGLHGGLQRKVSGTR